MLAAVVLVLVMVSVVMMRPEDDREREADGDCAARAALMARRAVNRAERIILADCLSLYC